MLCPRRQTPAERRRAEVLKQLNKIGGPFEAQRLVREHQLLGSSFQTATATTVATASASKAPWVNSAKAALLAKYPLFAQQLNTVFPGAFGAGEFIADLSASLGGLSFVPGDAIPMIAVCRDEITHPLIDAVESLWGNSFSLGSIAGMIFTGTTGLGAGIHHSPDINEVERFFCIACPHIAISDQGVIGKVYRPGVPSISSACGSLVAFQTELSSGIVNFNLSTTDLEQTLMKQQMSTYFQYGVAPALQDLTKDAQKLIKSQLVTALSSFNFTGVAEYAVVSGVQIHGPEGSMFFWPTDYYVIDTTGKRTDPGFQGFGQGLGAAFYEKTSAWAF